MPQLRNVLAVCFCLVAIHLLSSDAGAQIVSSSANLYEPTEFPKEPVDGPNGSEVVHHGGSFLDALPAGRRNNQTIRFESYEPSPLFLESADIEGELRLYPGSILDMFGGSIRGLVLEDFSDAFIYGGTVKALNPSSGIIAVNGGTVNIASYNPKNGDTAFNPNLPDDPDSRISPLSTPLTDSVIILDSGKLTGDFSLGSGSELVVTGGTIESTLGNIEGKLVATGGDFSGFSNGAISGQVDILASVFNNDFEGDRLTLNADNTIADPITGTFSDGEAFSFDASGLIDGGTVNLIKDLSEFEITPDQKEGAANGGSEFAGGVDVVFEEVTVMGTFSSDALETEADDLTAALGTEVAAPDFDQASEDVVQHWELDFGGQFEQDATLVFGYDELLLDVPEEELAIYHFDEELGIWESLEILNPDDYADTNRIRVRTRSFSPFVLGAAEAVAVPEPSSGLLLIGFMLSAGATRRRRS